MSNPRVTEVPTGGWFAVTADSEYPRIGVVGATEQEARDKYTSERDKWLALREVPVPPTEGGK